LHACHSTRSLRLSSTNLLSAPFVRTSFGSRSFSVVAPKIWNSLSFYLSVPVPVLTPSVVISRPTTASRPYTPLNPSPLAPQIRLCWPLCAFINYICLLTYLLTFLSRPSVMSFAHSCDRFLSFFLLMRSKPRYLFPFPAVPVPIPNKLTNTTNSLISPRALREAQAGRTDVLLMLLDFLVISVSPIVSKFTRPIFTKLARLIEPWL